MHELNLMSPGKLKWLDRPEPVLLYEDDAIVRPFVASRCDADWMAIAPAALRAVRLGVKLKVLDPIIREAVGPVPFAGPCAVGHECVAEVVQIGAAVTSVAVGDKVVVPYAVSCGQCDNCQRGLTTKCTITHGESGRQRPLACYGNGPVAGAYGCMISDFFRVPYANHMLFRLPDGLEPLRVAAASDNLADGWRCIIPHLRDRPGTRVLVVGGMGRAIGLYAAGIAAAQGAQIDYIDSDPRRLSIAESFGAKPLQRPNLLHFPKPHEAYDLVVEASNVPAGITYAIRSTAPGGRCVVPSYHMAKATAVPLMHMSFTDITLAIGPSHPGAFLSDVLTWVHDNNFPAEKLTPQIEDWNDAPKAYAEKRTIKPVVYRSPLT